MTGGITCTAWAKLRRDPVAITGGAVTALVAALALAAPPLFPGDPLDMAARPLTPPLANWAVPLGTDRLGRDLLSRILYGARISLTVGLIGVAISFTLGIVIGGIAGYYGGWIDILIQRLIEIIQCFPHLPLWMALSAR